MLNVIKTGDIALLQNEQIYDRGRMFNGNFTIRIDHLSEEYDEPTANFTIIDGEPGSIGISGTCKITQINKIRNHSPCN